ncbi:CDP-alcohol phosphatidyltransferase family protein [Kineococcus sp. R8]|uniref:CDP-alcohol phosphatidyltransferase family protein n=1 Tax=Kineococcus siccus TaxID=2696567 RepID=UPI001411FE74|nr:CDP-alcohol phosphatidyltransferase family protein [Kineococcus siccus]NAZ81994.1 CDP-alcohol phosphatidyltransferase family protein [Kineococcus siccus]
MDGPAQRPVTTGGSLCLEDVRLGPGDQVTLLRLLLTAVLAGAVAALLLTGSPVRITWVAVLASVAAALDAVDGVVARRTGTASAAGARFDVEADAVFLTVASIALVPTVGPWVLGIGALRYAFVAAAAVRPALRRPLPRSRSRRVVAGGQAVALVLALLPVTPVAVAEVAVGLALAALCGSFGRDVVRLELAARRVRR